MNRTTLSAASADWMIDTIGGLSKGEMIAMAQRREVISPEEGDALELMPSQRVYEAIVAKINAAAGIAEESEREEARPQADAAEDLQRMTRARVLQEEPEEELGAILEGLPEDEEGCPIFPDEATEERASLLMLQLADLLREELQAEASARRELAAAQIVRWSAQEVALAGMPAAVPF